MGEETWSMLMGLTSWMHSHTTPALGHASRSWSFSLSALWEWFSLWVPHPFFLSLKQQKTDSKPLWWMEACWMLKVITASPGSNTCEWPCVIQKSENTTLHSRWGPEFNLLNQPHKACYSHTCVCTCRYTHTHKLMRAPINLYKGYLQSCDTY